MPGCAGAAREDGLTMRVLVTGALGFTGGHLLPALTSAGHEVWALSRGAAPRASGEGMRWVSADLLRSAEVDAMVGEVRPDGVMHLAGDAGVGRSVGGVRGVLESFVVGTANLLEALGRLPHRPRVVVVSSSAVYGSSSPESVLTEDAPVHPVTPYGAAKAAQEIVAGQMARAGGLPLVIVRTFNLTGPGEPAKYVCGSLARQVAAVVRGGDRVIRTGRLDTSRDFVDVRDGVAAYRLLLDGVGDGTVFNVCSGVPVSIRGVLDRLLRLAGLDPAGVRIEPEAARVRATDILFQCGSAERLRGSTGWTPRWRLDDSLQALLEEALGRPLVPVSGNVIP